MIEVITRLFSHRHIYQLSASPRADIDARAWYTGRYENSRV